MDTDQLLNQKIRDLNENNDLQKYTLESGDYYKDMQDDDAYQNASQSLFKATDHFVNSYADMNTDNNATSRIKNGGYTSASPNFCSGDKLTVKDINECDTKQSADYG